MGSRHSSVGGRHGRRVGGWLRQLLVRILVQAVPRAVSPVALVSVVLDSVSSPSGAVENNNTETRERHTDRQTHRQTENSNSETLIIVIIIMYIYHALINALSAHMIHINLYMIFYKHVEHSPTKTIFIK